MSTQLLCINPLFRLPGNLKDLTALYWANQRLIDALYDVSNSPRTETAWAKAGDMEETADQLYGVQDKIRQSVERLDLTDNFDLAGRAEILIHWECQCGLSGGGRALRLIEIAHGLSVSVGGATAAISIAAE